ncbi:MAG: hypothetical protein ACLFQV_12110 [Vulcanimicrobiota bacterium]
MIVIAIISILASIIIPNIQKARTRAQLTACMGNLKAIHTAMKMYEVESVSQGVCWHDCNGNIPLIPDYLANMPTCPATGDIYGVNYNWESTNRQCFFMCCSARSGERGHPSSSCRPGMYGNTNSGIRWCNIDM